MSGKPCFRFGRRCIYYNANKIFFLCDMGRRWLECDPPAAWFMKGAKR